VLIEQPLRSDYGPNAGPVNCRLKLGSGTLAREGVRDQGGEQQADYADAKRE
jgi:hypothetical protein